MEIESPTLHPMGFGELLDATFSFYRTHFLRFLGITSIYLLAMLIGFSICLLDDSIGRNIRIAIWIPATGVIFGVSIFVVSVLMSATAQAYLDGAIRIGAVLKLGIRQFITCFVGAFLFGLIAIITSTLVGLLLGGLFSFFIQIPFNFFLTFAFSLLSSGVVIFAAVYFVSHWCFFAAVVLIEGKSMWDGIQRRGELIRRKSLQITGIMTTIVLLYLGVNFIFRFGFGFSFILMGLTNLEELRNVIQPVWLMQLPVFQNELRISYQLMHLILLGY